MQPSTLKDIAKTLGCTDEYEHYIELFQAYISERSIRSNWDEIIYLFTDKEWWENEDDDQIIVLSDVIQAVTEYSEKDEDAANRNKATADQNTTTEKKLRKYYLARGNVKFKYLNVIQIC